jgi:hypothetical protein
MLTKSIFIPLVTTLKQVIDSKSTEGIYPFMRFAKLLPSGGLDTLDCVPFARFREVPDRTDIIEVRSCDCDGSICKMPTIRLHLPIAQLEKYIFVEGDMMVMTFALPHSP